MAGRIDGLQPHSRRHAGGRVTTADQSVASLLFPVSPPSGTLAGSGWLRGGTQPRLAPIARSDRTGSLAATPQTPSPRTAGSTAPAPTLPASDRLPEKSQSTIETCPKMLPQKLVALTVPVAVAGVSPATFEPDVLGETPNTAGGDARARALENERALRVEVSLWRCFPPRVEGNCVLGTGRGEQLETK